MNYELTKAELRAMEATRLDPFYVQLHDVRTTVCAILDLFGRNNFFAEYTVHNYSHVQSMLVDLEWIIPDDTKKTMSQADWLMIVLAIYFHDLGLVVTEEEYNNRDKSTYSEFCEQFLFNGNDGKDYKAKISTLGSDKAERFFYQEFVRKNHGSRIKAWIEGNPTLELGAARAQISEINSLLNRLDRDFRSDLGIICESHNLDDLEDENKYRSFKPYGSSKSEVANLIFCAVILRTVDLLQITRQRAPSVLYRIINPTDPISQVEWTKQNAVKGVFPKSTRDTSDNSTPAAPDTISVYAKFTDENGFFGLTSYLSYAKKELAISQRLVIKANAKLDHQYTFPWKYIDDSTVEAVGFIPTPFAFKIDQSKILDLLTGHTLYNDSAVALRELIQNSLDAVRLQCFIEKVPSREFGLIRIEWDSKNFTLKITDNGTGMSQDIVEKHLLNVGSSRYQDPKFRSNHSGFSSISRFGIGVLSAFMVADGVQITTISKDEDMGRRISLRSVHGKYLIKLFDKHKDPSSIDIGNHGTSITLQIRGSSKQINVLHTIKNWIMFPNCRITVSVDGQDPIEVGYDSPKDALRKFIDNSPFFGSEAKRCEVHVHKTDGFEMAFVSRYNRHFRDRSFVSVTDQMFRDHADLPPIGICIEGIRVEFVSPGYPGRGVLAVINCTGTNAPLTNVSRSGLESVEEKKRLVKVAIDSYYTQVQIEIDRLQSEEGYSFVYATTQFPYIAGVIFNGPEYYARNDALKKFPLFVVEDNNIRKAASADELKTAGGFWSIDSNTIRALSSLLRDTDSTVTSRQVVEFCGFKGSKLPDGPLVLNPDSSSAARSLILKDFYISELRGSITDRRLDAKWDAIEGTKHWLHSEDLRDRVSSPASSRFRELQQFWQHRSHKRRAECSIPLREIPVVGLDGYFLVVTLDRVFILPNTPVAEYLAKIGAKDDWKSTLQMQLYIDVINPSSDRFRYVRSLSARSINQNLKDTITKLELESEVDPDEFMAIISKMEDKLEVFDPFSWHRDENSDEDDDIPF